MFGQNPIRSAESDPSHLALEDAFHTIQGEGPYGGMPALFVRLAGCNLACHFCDTQFETQANNRRPVQEVLEELLQRFTPKDREFVVLTGGEPLRQNFLVLLEGLFHHGTKLVQIETAGTLWVPGLEDLVEVGKVVLVCSPKTPRVHVQVSNWCWHWKYIVRAGEAGEDGLPRRGTQLATRDKLSHVYRPHSLYNAPPLDRGGDDGEDTIWLSPCDEYDPDKNRANMEAARDLCLQHGYRLSLQMHKIIGVA